ncbi:retinol dehydrogenase 11-like [Ostrinia furnacalis]|uniref:retinol dehydrogenase 11-like n=1 Tax=Ostrinia furnacalis TaxID=93504 RepID=UPI001038C011|nr:retinol dehydrogenase 11-like [Ostrinia furnacalis]
MVLYLIIQYFAEFCLCSLIVTILSIVCVRFIGEKNVPCKCTARLDGKTVLVTGGSMGIGLATARDLARRGARLILTCVNEHTAKAAAEELIATTGNQDIHYRQLDLSSFDNIQNFAQDINENFDKLHILLNNAGKSCQPTDKIRITEDGIESTMQVNFVGGALLTLLLLPKLNASKPSRIVNTSSKAFKTHQFILDDITTYRPIFAWKIYSNSKLCVLLWTKALSRRLPDGITANALHPGTVNTNIYVTKNDRLMNYIFTMLVRFVFKTPAEGAQTSIHCCVASSLEGVTGQYLADCQISESVEAFDDFEYTEKIWEKTMAVIKSRLPDEVLKQVTASQK